MGESVAAAVRATIEAAKPRSFFAMRDSEADGGTRAVESAFHRLLARVLFTYDPVSIGRDRFVYGWLER